MKITITFLLLYIFCTTSYAQGTISGSLNNAMGICMSDSILWSWGYSHVGQNNPSYLNPHPVWADSTGGQLQKVVSVSTYYTHAIAALSDGTVWAWGQNSFGQLGDSLINSNTNYPVQMRGEYGFGYLDSIDEVSCGYYHSLMLKSDGTVWSCGYNTYGQLGVNSTQTWTVPMPVVGPNGVGNLTNIIQIDAGSHSSIALRNDGTVWVWGNGALGTMGSGTGHNYYPEQVSGLPQISKISIKGGHVLALDINGEIWSWGENTYGQVGDNTFNNVYYPVQVLDQTGANVMDSIIDIGTGMMHSFAIHGDGTAYSWGANNNGQLGDGTTIDRYFPVEILGPGGNGVLGNIVELEGGHLLSVARKSDGTIFCWGENYTSYPEQINGICGSLSINENNNFSSGEISLFPNPTSGNSAFNIVCEKDNINSIRIISPSGKILKSIENLQVNHLEVELNGFLPGIYFVTICSASAKTTKRLLVH